MLWPPLTFTQALKRNRMHPGRYRTQDDRTVKDAWQGTGLSLVAFDIGGDGIDALEVFLRDTGHGHAEVGIHEGDDFEGIDGIETDFFAKERGVELENVAIYAEIGHKEGLELAFHFFVCHCFLSKKR